MQNILALQALELDTDSYTDTFGWSTISNYCCTQTYLDGILTTVGN